MKHQTALITGASRGIGEALARELANRGTRVVLAARSEVDLQRVAEDIRRRGGHAQVAVVDVAETAATVRTIRELDVAVGGFDLVIANAGVDAPRHPPESFVWENLENACQVNFVGAAATLTAVLPNMVERRRGHLVGISSIAAYGPLPGGAAYCAPKAGLSMFLECLRFDLRDTGVRVTDVHPGFVRTSMLDNADHPLPLLMECADAARLMVNRLSQHPAELAFPRPLAMAAHVSAHLPRRVRDFLFGGVAKLQTSRGPAKRHG